MSYNLKELCELSHFIGKIDGLNEEIENDPLNNIVNEMEEYLQYKTDVHYNALRCKLKEHGLDIEEMRQIEGGL